MLSYLLDLYIEFGGWAFWFGFFFFVVLFFVGFFRGF